MPPRIPTQSADRLFRLDGRVALVTGAAGHIGRSLAFALAQSGAHVILSGRREKPLADLHREIVADGLEASVVVMDVTDDDAIERGFASVQQNHQRLDVLVNNAYAGRGGTIQTATPSDFAGSYDVGVVGAHRCLSAGSDLLEAGARDVGHASVVNIASMYASVSPDAGAYDRPESTNPPFYGAAKAALLQYTRYAACELAARGIRVNAISPGPFPSPRVEAQDPSLVRSLAAKTPLRRIGHPDELRGALLFLASDAASYVTGTNLAVDGGWTAW